MPRGRPRKTFAPVIGGVGGAVDSLQALRSELASQRAALDVQIQAIDNALRSIGSPLARPVGAPLLLRPRVGRPPGSTNRGPRPGSLKSYIEQVLGSGGVVAVKDITSGVLKAGYKTTNKTLAKSVGIALTEMKGVLKVGRGRFRLK